MVAIEGRREGEEMDFSVGARVRDEDEIGARGGRVDGIVDNDNWR